MISNANYKKCPNGHYYSVQLSACPYCNSENGATEFQPTQPGDGMNAGGYDDGKTRPMGDVHANAGGFDDGKTRPVGDMGYTPNQGETNLGGNGGNYDPEGETIMPGFERKAKPEPPKENKTVIIDEEEQQTDEGFIKKVTVQRSRRKLVGWLVSYTLDEMGVDFKLYEGKNVLGRNSACQIAIQDPAVSGEHATILFRNGKYSIKDNQSTSGTFVNEEDIELDAIYLKDGDVIRVGKTLLKFRMSL